MPPSESAANGTFASRAAFGETLRKTRGAGGERVVEAGRLDQLQRLQTGGDRDRIARQRARLIDAAERREVGHDVAPAAEGRRRHAAADHLAETREVRRDAVDLLRAAERDAETAHHFVENQHRAVLGAQAPQGLQEFRRGAHEVHVARDRLDDHRGDLVAERLERFFEFRDVVVLEHRGVLGDIGRHARRGRIAEGEQARAGFDQQAIRVTVIAAFELDDAAAVREAARETQRAHGRFGAARDHAHLFDRRHQFADFFGDFDFGFGRRAEREAVGQHALHGFQHFGMDVAEDHRAPRADVVDIALAVRVPEVRAFARVR